MEPYSFANAALTGFFGFAAVHYALQWWHSREERILAAFALHCALCALFCPWLIVLAHAETVREAQFALDVRTSLGLVTHGTALSMLALLGGAKIRWVVPATVAAFVAVAVLNLIVPLNGTVTALEQIPLPGGGLGTYPVRPPAGWWMPVLYAAITAAYAYGLPTAASLWKRDRTGAILIALACIANMVSMGIVAVLIDLARLRAPYVGAVPQASFVLLMAAFLAREYAARGARIIASERRFQMSFEHAAIGMALTTPDGVWLQVNRALCRLLGYSEAELESRSFRSLTHPEDLDTDLDLIRRLNAGEFESYQREKRYLRKDGAPVWAHISVALVRDQQGSPLNAISQIQDITERVEAERERERLIHDLGERVKELRLLHQAARFLSPERPLTREVLLELAQEIPLAWRYPECCEARISYGDVEVTTAGWRESPWGLSEPFSTSAGSGVIEVAYLEQRSDADEGPFLTEEKLVLNSLAEMLRVAAESRHAQQALARREEFYRAILEHSSDNITVLALDGSVRYASPSSERLTGFTPDELVGANSLQAVHTDDLDLVASGLMRDFERDEPGKPIEYRYRHRDGVWRWFESVGRRFIDDQGSPVAIVNTRDVTERRDTEQSRREQEARFRGMFERAAIGVALVDPSGWLVESNPALAAMLGYGAGELPAMSFMELTHPEDLRADWELYGELVEGSRNFYRLDKRYLRKDGSVMWGRLTVSMIRDEQGRPSLAIGMVEDVTESKQAREALERSEERYRSLVAASAQVIWTTNAEGAVLDDLPSWREVTGQTREEFLRPGGWLEAVHPEDREGVARAWSEAVRSRTMYQTEYRVRAAEGGYRNLVLRGIPVLDEDGAVREWVGTATDVTERVRLQQQFLQAQKMEAVGRLAGGVAHDFNNMLAVINGFTELSLNWTPEEDPRRENLVQVLKAGERASSLTRQLLMFSRQEVLSRRRVRLNDVVSDMEKMLKRLIGEDIQIRLKPEADVWEVLADVGQVEQVLMNLAVNARDAMPGGGSLTIETRNITLAAEDLQRMAGTPEPGEFVMLSVTDTGTGIEPAVLERIFEPFFTTKAAGVGTGLGLATVYGIVEQSMGALQVWSEVGAGTSFRVFLPRVPEDPAGAKRSERRAPLPRGTETLLVVEDEPLVRSVAQTVLQGLGYQVLLASGGKEALALCADHPEVIHLLLTDVVMPELSGREVADRVREARPEIRVLHMSGYTPDAITRHGVESGHLEFLQKPFTPTGLAQKVREVLDAPAEKPA